MRKQKKIFKKVKKNGLCKISELHKAMICHDYAIDLSSEKIIKKHKWDNLYTTQQVAAVKAHYTMGTY